MAHPEWLEQDERPEPVRPSGPTFAVGQRVAVLTFGDPPDELQGEIRAIDGGLAVVRIGDRLERVPLDRIKPA
jgi:hypothetical protein